MKANPLASDLNYILEKAKPFWNELREQKIFISGGTGFFGCWLLESFLWVNKALNLNAQVTVLTRNPEHFAKKYPHLFHQDTLSFYEGDVCDFNFPSQTYSHVIHAATDTKSRVNNEYSLSLFKSITQGTEHMLSFARHCGAKKFLLTSSGAVYGQQPENLSHIPENFPCQPTLFNAQSSSYALGKCAAEHLAYLHAKAFSLEVKIARCFAFVGPYLPLDGPYAIANFINDGLQGSHIQIKGDGTPFRSYLYAADLTLWLWYILFNGKAAYPYNVGSDEAYCLLDVAKLVAKSFDKPPLVKQMQVKKEGTATERYVPNIDRVRTELSLTPQVKLVDAIRLTKEWHQA